MDTEEQWYYMLDKGSQGPETLTRLLELLENGTINRTTPVWQAGSVDWCALGRALHIEDSAPPPIPGTGTFEMRAPQPQTPLPRDDGYVHQIKSFATGYTDTNPHPWRRYFARMLDTTIGGTAIWFIIGSIFASVDQDTAKAFTDYVNQPDSRFINICTTLFFATFPNALLIGFTGSSLGKWIFGVKVSRKSGQSLGFRAAFWREMLVWFRGWGLGIPIISLFTLVTGFRTLKNEKCTSWDRDMAIQIDQRPPSGEQTGLNLFGVALWLGVLVSLMVLPHV